MPSFGESMRDVLGLTGYVNDQYQQGVERKRKNSLADLMGQAASGGAVDAQGIARNGGDPFAVQGQVDKMQDREQAEVGQIAAILAGADPSRRPEIFAHPETQAKLRAFAAKRGLPLPSVWDERILPEVQQIAQVWGGNAQGKPAGLQEFEAMTRGFTPEQKAQAARVWAGIEGRASSAGIKFGEIQLGDMKTYATRQNPRTGQMEALTDNGWQSLGDGQGMGGGAPAGAPGPSAGPSAGVPNVMDLTQALELAGGVVTSGYRDPANNSRVGGVSNSQHKVGTARDWVAPNPQIKAQVADWAKRQGWEVIDEGDHLHFEVPPQRGGLPSVASPTPGEIKADEVMGSKGAEFAVDRQRAGFDVEQAAAVEAAKSRAGATGEAQGKAEAALPGAIRKADEAITLIREARKHPGRKTATGLSGTIDPRNRIPGTDAYDFRVRAKQLQGKAFLEAFESLKGGGAITDREGQAATDAMARFDLAQSDEEYDMALADLESILVQGQESAREKAGRSPTGRAASPGVGTVIRYDAQGKRIP